MRVYEIAQLVDGELYGDGNHEICNVADLGNASSSELTFAEGERALQQAAASQAGCILIPEGVSLRGHTVIRVKHPKLAFIAAANALHPSKLAAPGIHPTAVLSPTASVPASASVGPHVTIDDHATIGERCSLAGRPRLYALSGRPGVSRRSNWQPRYIARRGRYRRRWFWLRFCRRPPP